MTFAHVLRRFAGAEVVRRLVYFLGRAAANGRALNEAAVAVLAIACDPRSHRPDFLVAQPDLALPTTSVRGMFLLESGMRWGTLVTVSSLSRRGWGNGDRMEMSAIGVPLLHFANRRAIVDALQAPLNWVLRMGVSVLRAFDLPNVALPLPSPAASIPRFSLVTA